MEALLEKFLREVLTITACLSRNNKRKSGGTDKTSNEQIRMSIINSLYVEGTSEKLQHTQSRIHFNTKNTLYKLLCKLKD